MSLARSIQFRGNPITMSLSQTHPTLDSPCAGVELAINQDIPMRYKFPFGLISPRIAPWRVFMAACALVASVAAGGEESGNRVNFARQILPILSDKCFVCHGPDSGQATDFRLDSFEAATSDRGGYRAIDPDQPLESVILARIHSVDDPMPPQDAEKRLTESERSLLADWVKQGGGYALHWSLVPPTKSRPFRSMTEATDELIRESLRDRGVDFSPEADQATLARRVAMVLTGLPPEPEQLDQFLDDPTAGAYERYVDRLLASQRFGEHQARYWLDAVRYGDTHGLHLDNRRGIYPYRDWVVRALNENLPLDEFIRWQVAGDLYPNATLEQRLATGFVRMNPSTGEGGAIPDEFQMKNNFDRVETLGTVFLGLSLTCARCHTHKYDPIEQTEYYRLLAFFNSTAEPSMDGNSYTYGPVVRVPPDQPAWTRWQQLEQQADQLLSRWQAASPLNVEAALAYGCTDWPSCSLSHRLSMLFDASGPIFMQQTESEREELVAEARRLAAAMSAEELQFTTSLVASELTSSRETFLLRRGEYDLPEGDPLSPGTPKVLGAIPPDAPANRLGLAMWLTSREHPLTARVLANRIWQGIFGHALVRTPEDFGLQGQQPTHPELLDWLAVEMHDGGWNLKALIRSLVLSRTFRQSAAWRSDLDDPENRLFARAASYRFDAEVLRDIGLWASGLLDPRMGGEGVKPYQPDGMWAALAHPASNTKKYERDHGSLLYRRSLYVYWKRTSPHPMMTLFDAPDRESSCVRRSRTNTPLQSLGLLNETQRIEIGRVMASRTLHESDQDDERIHRMFRRLACRNAVDSELAACRELLHALRQRYRESPEDAAALLSVGDAPRDESIPQVELAAWSQLATTILASDLAIMMY